MSTLTRATRLERVDEALEQRRQKLASTRDEIAELEAGEGQAAAKSLRTDPLKSAFSLRSPAQELRRKRTEAEKSVANLEREIVLLEAERVGAARERAAGLLVDRVESGRDLMQRERDARLVAGKAFAELAESWNAVSEALEQRSELLARVGHERLVEEVGHDSEVAARWAQVSGFVVTPVPTTFAAFVDELLEAATAERTDVEAEYRAVDELNARRREFAKRDPGGADDLPMIPRPVIEPNPLDELVPDLRGEVAVATVISAPVRRARGPEAVPWPDVVA